MSQPDKTTSLLFLIKDDQILLAMKKRGFGEGYWNGVGGKPEPGETIELTAVRECQEEIGVTPIDFHEVAKLDFHFKNEAGETDWTMFVTAFVCTNWEGEPQESEEMKPQWYNVSDIPYDHMWQDDPFWIPEVLAGNYVTADFDFNNDNNMLAHSLSAKPIH